MEKEITKKINEIESELKKLKADMVEKLMGNVEYAIMDAGLLLETEYELKFYKKALRVFEVDGHLTNWLRSESATILRQENSTCTLTNSTKKIKAQSFGKFLSDIEVIELQYKK